VSIKYSEATPSIVALVEALTRECLIGELLELVGVGCHLFDKGVHTPRWTETPGRKRNGAGSFSHRRSDLLGNQLFNEAFRGQPASLDLAPNSSGMGPGRRPSRSGPARPPAPISSRYGSQALTDDFAAGPDAASRF
jgi:hypothetical protein